MPDLGAQSRGDRSGTSCGWAGRQGQTARLAPPYENTVGHVCFPHLKGRVAGPIYSGRITPAKWFIQGWRRRLEPLLCLNDVAIRRVDTDWESVLCQFLEVAGPRTIRWDLKSRATLEPETAGHRPLSAAEGPD